MALDFFAGCLGGCAGVLLGHPFDTVKVRLQTQDSTNKMYRGTFHCLKSIVKQESFQGLYKGMSSPMAGVAVVNAVVFGVYGNVVRASASPSSLQNQFLAGSVAGLAQSLVTSPMELAKTRMQLQGQQRPGDKPLPFWQRNRVAYSNPLDCLKKTFRAEGLFGVYRGLGCTILRDVPAFGVYFAAYECLSDVAKDAGGRVSALALFCVGGAAGVLSWTVTYPLDVMKSRLQADGMSGAGKKYRNLWDCLGKSYRDEGLRVFTKGLNSTLIRAFPTNAATFTVYSWIFCLYEASLKKPKLAVEESRNVLLLDQEMQTLVI